MSTKLNKINVFISYEDIAERLGLEDSSNLSIGKVERDETSGGISLEIITPRDNIIDENILELTDKGLYRIMFIDR